MFSSRVRPLFCRKFYRPRTNSGRVSQLCVDACVGRVGCPPFSAIFLPSIAMLLNGSGDIIVVARWPMLQVGGAGIQPGVATDYLDKHPRPLPLSERPRGGD